MALPDIEYLLLIAYIIGSIPTSFWIGKIFFGINLLEHGSKNVGATNAWRVLGPPMGILVLIFDLLKGYIPVYWSIVQFSMESPYPIYMGIACVVGHSMSPFLKFRGGKGVATSAGFFLAMAPAALGVSLGVFLIIILITRFVSLGSMVASVCFPIFSYLFYSQNPLVWQVGAVVSLLILLRHRANIGRLIAGNENKLSFSKSKDL